MVGVGVALVVAAVVVVAVVAVAVVTVAVVTVAVVTVAVVTVAVVTSGGLGGGARVSVRPRISIRPPLGSAGAHGMAITSSLAEPCSSTTSPPTPAAFSSAFTKRGRRTKPRSSMAEALKRTLLRCTCNASRSIQRSRRSIPSMALALLASAEALPSKQFLQDSKVTQGFGHCLVLTVGFIL